MSVSLVLQPAVERSRSMLLYAERLLAHCPPSQGLSITRLPGMGGRVGGLLSDLFVPPVVLPRLRDGVAHVVDHAHAGYVRFLRVPTVVTVHDLIPLKSIRGLYPALAGASGTPISRKASIWFRWNVRVLPKARLLVAPSCATADDVRRLIGDIRVEVVPHGVDPEFSAAPSAAAMAQIRRRLGPLADRRIVLQVTNGFFYKNDAGFARAWALLRQRVDDVAWVRVGAPPGAGFDAERGMYYANASLDELVALYRLARVLLFPSWDEGFGWPPLEAMAAGCPVVASDRGALRETAAPAARIVDAADPTGMAEEVLRVLESHDLASELTERGREHAATYRWSDAGARMAELYAEIDRCT